MGVEMGKVIPVTLRATGEDCPPITNCAAVPANIDEAPRTVGQDLYEARQRRAKTLADVAGALKISQDYLAAIEESRFQELPARVYAVGYVRSYAAYLGVDTQSFVARFKAEMTSAGISDPPFILTPQPDCDPGTEQDSPAPAGIERPSFRLPSFRWPALPENAISQAAGALLLIGAVTYSVYHVMASAPRLATPVATVPARLAAESELAGEPIAQPPAPQIAPVLRVPREASLHEVDFGLPTIDLRLLTAAKLQPKYVEPPPPDTTKLASAKPEQVPLPVRKDSRTNALPPPDTTKLASVKPEQAPPPLPKDSPTNALAQKPVIQSVEVGVIQRVSTANAVRLEPRHALRLGQHYGTEWKFSRITLRLHGPTEVRVGDNRNNVLIDRALDAGDTYRVPDVIGLKLSAPDAGAIEIILDDTTVGFAGRDGVPARQISLDPKALVRQQKGG